MEHDLLQKPKEQQYNKVKILIDLLLLILAFSAAYFIKRGHFLFEAIYIKFLPLYFGCWFVSSVLTRKLKNLDEESGYMKRIEPFFSSALFFTGLLSLFIYGLQWYNLSRLIVFGSLGLFLFLEILVLSGSFLPLFAGKTMIVTSRLRFPIFFFLLEFVLLTASFFTVHFYKEGSLNINEEYQDVLLLLYFLWIFAGLIIHKFQLPREKNYIKMTWPFVKTDFIVLSISSLVVFGFRTGFSRILVFGSLGLFGIAELLVVTLYYLHRLQKQTDIPRTDFMATPIPPIHWDGDKTVQEVIKKEKEDTQKITVSRKKFSSSLIREKLKAIYLKGNPRIYKFIDRNIDLDSVDILRAEVIDTGNPYNVEILPDKALDFFVNLHTLNDYRRVNEYLGEVNRALKKKGVFISKFEPCERRFLYFINNYPNLLANLLYFFDFLWKRVFPKLPLLKRLYFAVSKGENRAFSMAEALGRLYYNGFEIVSLDSPDNFVYFIVRKIAEPQPPPYPSYGLLFKQKRVGQHGKTVYIYKMRTMHPYSEYIHQYVYDKFKLDEKGKIKGDFRITAWGRFFRKIWIDEIPMLLNLLKRDIKLVGVRPLSETFFNTYPEDVQKERIKYKPGLVPPYYADMPTGIEAVWESERVYLKAYAQHPLKTDIRYFFKALANILLHKAKSR